MHCFIVDYKNEQNENFCCPMIAFPLLTGSLREAAESVKALLEERGYRVSSIALIEGEHTLEELGRIASHYTEAEKVKARPLYINPAVAFSKQV